MRINDIVRLINKKLADSTYNYYDLRPYMDEAIDAINEQLQSCYPAFSEIPENATNYNYFPDRYIRTVIVSGAAHFFYLADEEGINATPALTNQYLVNLTNMQRQFAPLVPMEYRDSTSIGVLDFDNAPADSGVSEGFHNIIEEIF